MVQRESEERGGVIDAEPSTTCSWSTSSATAGDRPAARLSAAAATARRRSRHRQAADAMDGAEQAIDTGTGDGAIAAFATPGPPQRPAIKVQRARLPGACHRRRHRRRGRRLCAAGHRRPGDIAGAAIDRDTVGASLMPGLVDYLRLPAAHHHREHAGRDGRRRGGELRRLPGAAQPTCSAPARAASASTRRCRWRRSPRWRR
jgi:hypothetical protein